MRKRYILFTLIIIIAAVVALFTLSGNAPHYKKKPLGKPNLSRQQQYILTSVDEEFLKDFDDYLTKSFKDTNTPGAAVAIVKEGTVIYEKGFGLKSSNGTDSVNTHTLFRLASVSKGFSAILTGLMVKDSLLEWNDPMSGYISFPLVGDASDITIRNILSHTTGFPYQAYSTLVEDELPRDTMIHRLLKLPLSRHPGEIHSYQNVAYSIIEEVLEDVTQKPFRQLMYERIFLPLGMEDASICYDSMVSSFNMALPHGYSRRKFVPTHVNRSYYNVAAAGGINASISDMAKWLKAVLGNNPDIIPKEVLTQVFDPVIQIRVKNRYFSNLYHPRKGYYGMGWRIIRYPHDTIIYHGGYANGYKSGIALQPSKNIGICVLTNAPAKFSNLAMVGFFKKYKEYFEEEEKDSTVLAKQ